MGTNPIGKSEKTEQSSQLDIMLNKVKVSGITWSRVAFLIKPLLSIVAKIIEIWNKFQNNRASHSQASLQLQEARASSKNKEEIVKDILNTFANNTSEAKKYLEKGHGKGGDGVIGTLPGKGNERWTFYLNSEKKYALYEKVLNGKIYVDAGHPIEISDEDGENLCNAIKKAGGDIPLDRRKETAEELANRTEEDMRAINKALKGFEEN
jgi:hypothetical protein